MDSQEILQQIASEQFMIRAGFQVDALKKLKKLELQGSGNAAHLLSLLYEDGFECGFLQKLMGYGNTDKELAKHFREKAIELESSSAQFELAWAYYYGDTKETGIKKEQNYVKAYHWATLCVDNQEYSEITFIAMSLLAELYANGLGCNKNYYHAILLRTIAEQYNSFYENKWIYVDKSFEITPKLEVQATTLGLAYFHTIKNEDNKPKVAFPDSSFVSVFINNILKNHA